MPKIEWVVFAVLCLLAVILNVLLFYNSGAFWRDEAGTIQLAMAPSLGQMWQWLSRDSFPLLFPSLVRCWIFAGPGASDAGLRLLGTLISLGVIVSLIVSCWVMVRRIPLLAIPLVALNAHVFYYGSSLRAYGLAAALIVLCLAAFWRLVEKPTRWNIAASVALALLSSHSNYHNAYLLLAIGVAGAAACGVCRLWKRSLLVLGICAMAAASMLIYLPAIRENREALEVVTTAVDWGTIAGSLYDSLNDPNPWVSAVVLLPIFAVLGSAALSRRSWQSASQTPSLLLFCLVAMVVATIGGSVFFKASGMVPFEWHYVPFLAFIGVLIEVAVALAPGSWSRKTRLATCGLLVLLSSPGWWEAAQTRRTNMDVISRVLESQAGPDDLILTNPYYYSPALSYYYHGRARWSTLPRIFGGPDLAICPYFGIKPLLATPNAIGPTLDAVDKTLAAGHRLWIVGTVLLPTTDAPPPSLPPAPLPESGWLVLPYLDVWSTQLGYVIHRHHREAHLFSIDLHQPVSGLEKPALIVIEYCRAGATTLRRRAGRAIPKNLALGYCLAPQIPIYCLSALAH